MIIGLLSIIAAISVSIISAYFSITGIRIIFSGAVISVTYMMASLEFGKIISTVWLYKWWKKSVKLVRTYLIIAVVILILISSLGIFSFLSRAFSQQNANTGNVQVKIERVDNYIDREKRNIEKAQDQLDMLDEAIDKYLELDVVTRGIEAREEQREDRENLNTTIQEAEDKIAEHEDEKFELKQQLNTLEVEVGPIKHIASLLYGEKDAEQHYDTAARILIILIVIVFDPFAVLLMVAGNIALDKRPKKQKGRPKGSKNKTNKKPNTSTPPQEESTREVNKETPPKLHKRRRVVKK